MCLARQLGRGMDQRHHVLQLVAEAKRAAGLVERRAAPDAARQALVQQPAIQQQVHGGIRRVDLHRTQQIVPKVIDCQPGPFDLGRILEARGQRHRFGAIGALAEQEPHLFAAARRQVDVQLEHGTRIEAGLDGAAQADTAQRRRLCQAAQAAQELAAVCGQTVEALAGGGKGDPPAELGVPRVARQQRLAGVIELGDDELGGDVTRDAEHPFGIEGGSDAPGALRGVFEPQLDDLDRAVRRHEQAQPLTQPVAMVLENGIARAMPHQVGSRGSARLRRRRPDLGRLLVTQVERLAGPVRDRIVGPGRQAVLAAVQRPGGAAAGLGDQEAELRVGHHIDPGGRRLLPGSR